MTRPAEPVISPPMTAPRAAPRNDVGLVEAVGWPSANTDDVWAGRTACRSAVSLVMTGPTAAAPGACESTLDHEVERHCAAPAVGQIAAVTRQRRTSVLPKSAASPGKKHRRLKGPRGSIALSR